MSATHELAQQSDIEDKAATLTLDGAAEADEWLRANGNLFEKWTSETF